MRSGQAANAVSVRLSIESTASGMRYFRRSTRTRASSLRWSKVFGCLKTNFCSTFESVCHSSSGWASEM
jgi:hypothetical protein